MLISSSFGTLEFRFDEGSFIPVFVTASSSQVNYDVKSSVLTITMDEATLLKKFGSNEIKVTLIDDFRKQTDYTIYVNFIDKNKLMPAEQ